MPDTTKYILDIGVMALGYAALSNIVIRNLAHPFMQEMSLQVQAPVAIATRDRLNMLYLDVIQTNSMMRRQIGSTLSLYSSAMGRACLAAAPITERNILMKALEKQYPKQWSEINSGLQQAFRDYEQHGYCVSLGEWKKDINSVAVPLLNSKHGLFVFNCGAPNFQISVERIEKEIDPMLKFMVNNIHEALLDIS